MQSTHRVCQGSATDDWSQANDGQVVRRVLDGDSDAFSLLISRYQDHVIKVVRGKVGRNEVLDVCQDVFVRAFTGLKGYDPDRPFKHWLSGIAVRAACDYWRRRNWRREVPNSALSESELYWLEAKSAGGPGREHRDAYEQYELEEILEWGLSKICPKDRMVLVLTHMEGHSIAEAAELMGWSKANVKVRAFRARRQLRGLLKSSFGQ